jgi:hypothetical protein
MHCRQATQHRDEQLVIRLARPLKRELEGAAAEERRRSTAALVREILVEWAAARMTEKERHDGVISS